VYQIVKEAQVESYYSFPTLETEVVEKGTAPEENEVIQQ